VALPYPEPATNYDLLDEAAELLQLIGENAVDLVLHGHRHHPSMKTISENHFSTPCTIISAGSFGVNAAERPNAIDNMIHAIKLSRTHVDSSIEGELHSFAFRDHKWIPQPTSTTHHLDSLRHFGPLADQAALEREADALLNSLNVVPKPVVLPKHAQLPFILKCQHVNDLNRLLHSRALAMGITLHNNYHPLYTGQDDAPVILK
jgi:hypothetical protein